jgi:hypothetical protein
MSPSGARVSGAGALNHITYRGHAGWKVQSPVLDNDGGHDLAHHHALPRLLRGENFPHCKRGRRHRLFGQERVRSSRRRPPPFEGDCWRAGGPQSALSFCTAGRRARSRIGECIQMGKALGFNLGPRLGPLTHDAEAEAVRRLGQAPRLDKLRRLVRDGADRVRRQVSCALVHDPVAGRAHRFKRERGSASACHGVGGGEYGDMCRRGGRPRWSLGCWGGFGAPHCWHPAP